MAYTPLRISTIRPHKALTFDLYIFFQEKFLRYADTGKKIEDEHLVKLKKQKIAKFFITDKDEEKYQQFLDEILTETMQDESLSVEKKAEVVEGAATTAVERMKENPASRSAYRMTEQAAGSLRQIISANKDALKIILGKQASDDDIIIKHSLNVSMLATKLGIAEELNDDELDNLSTAAMIHDLGLLNLSLEEQKIALKPRKLLTAQERKIYDTHPKDTANLLRDKAYVNKKIISLIMNHEENLSGQGPERKSKLTKSEEILSLTDTYDKRVMCLNMSASEAIADVSVEELGNYDLNLIKALKKILKMEELI